MDSNHGPHPYQGCALTNLSYKPKNSMRVQNSEFDLIHALNAGLLLRKEVIQPHLPVRLPCYDFVTGGVYKTRERIHRGMLIHDY